MNSVATQQIALDNALVAPEKRLNIEKCNARIKFSKPKREATYQVTLDTLKLSPCYPAFLITAEICPILPNQEFVEPTSDEELFPFIQERGCISGKTTGLDRLRSSRAQILWGMFNQKNVDYVALLWEEYSQKFGALILEEMINQDIKDSASYKTYLAFATGTDPRKKSIKFKKVVSPLKKLSPILEEDPTKKDKRAKKPAMKFTTMPTLGVVIRDTLGVFVSKKKTPAKDDRCKGIDILSDVTLLKAALLKKDLKKSKNDSHMLHASGSSEEVGSQPKVPNEFQDKTNGTDEGTSTKLLVPDVPNYQSESENESWGDSSDDNNGDDSDHVNDDDDGDSNVDGDDKASDSEKIDSNKDKRDAKMTDAGLDDATQETSYEQVKEDAHVTLTAAYVTQKTEADNEVASVLNVKVCHEEPTTQTPSLLTIPITTTPTPTPTTKPSTTLIPTLPDFLSLFGFNQRVSVLEKDPSQLKQVDYAAQLLVTIKSQIPAMRYIDLVKKSVKDIIKDEVKSQLPQILPKELSDFATPVIQSIISESLENVVFAKSSSQPQSTYKATASLTKFELKKILLDKMQKSKSAQAEEPVFEAADTELPHNQGSDLGNTDDQANVEADSRHECIISQAEKPPRPAYNLLKGTCKSLVELEYHFEECYKAVTDQLDWHNPEGQEYPFDLSKPLPLIKDQGRQVVHVDYFINNDLEYLKGGSSRRKYTTSKTKTKAAKYDN
ncbi:hypothetical protein Tco_0233195 [Tanacetum coccineum]